MKLHLIDQQLLQVLQRVLKLDDMEIAIGDATQNQRQTLRQQTRQWLTEKNISFDESRLLDLSVLPKMACGDLSLSHSRSFQGMMISQNAKCLGFDIEDPDRVTEALVLRVSDEKQLQSAPSASHLWVAKEAAFKAFSKSRQAQLMSDVHINQWMPLQQGVFAVSASFQEHRADGFLVASSACFYSGFNS